MSDTLKIEQSKNYIDADGKTIRIENQITLSFGKDSYLAFQGVEVNLNLEMNYEKVHVYTDHGRGISGLHSNTGFSFPSDLVKLSDNQW